MTELSRLITAVCRKFWGIYKTIRWNTFLAKKTSDQTERGSDVHGSRHPVEFQWSIGRFGGLKFPRCHTSYFLWNISSLEKSVGRTLHIYFLSMYQCFWGSSDALVTLNRLEMANKSRVGPTASMRLLRIVSKSKP